MEVTVDNINCVLTKSKSSERDFVEETLSFWVSGAEYSQAYRKGYWDGYRRLYRRGARNFLSGLLPLVAKACAGGNITLSIIDRRDRPKRAISTNLSTESWVSLLESSGIRNPSYARCKLQVDGIKTILHNRFGDLRWSRGIIQLPTGTGKTILAAGLIQTLYDLPSLFLVDRKDPLWQTKEVFEKLFDDKIGIIGDGKLDIQHHTVATVQSVSNALKSSRPFARYLGTIGLLVVDECHKVANNNYLKVIRNIPAYFRIGLSATALERESVDTLYLIGALGDVIYELSSQEAVKRGFLAKPIVRFIQIKEPVINTHAIYSGNVEERQQAARENYQEVYRVGVVENETRNKRIIRFTKKAFEKGYPTMVLVRSLYHGRALTRNIRKSLPEAVVEYLSGADASIRRRETTRRFRSGKVDVLIASTIFDEAVDIPNIRYLILAGGGKSPIKSIQRIGRGMRKKKGENILRVIDFFDQTHKYLLEHSLARLKVYERKGYTIKAKGIVTDD